MIRSCIYICFALLLLFPSVGRAADDGLYIKNISVQRLQNLYNKYGYTYPSAFAGYA